jgi:hypothetical protein
MKSSTKETVLALHPESLSSDVIISEGSNQRPRLHARAHIEPETTRERERERECEA